ncbi:uncharacterized protein LOC120353570 [Nilaparvata lugens]|uniref:uncharacterized protein LOC120353570 n=1 Tax=Nilaparvata lugens TaxID=108931 RepID=UPI00193CEAD8|nr:uncharacterized protein LOC120353570 [Nilaparvata lugens]
MGSRKSKPVEVTGDPSTSLECYRPFGSVISPMSNQNNPSTHVRELFMKIGTNLGQITAYYEHVHEPRSITTNTLPPTQSVSLTTLAPLNLSKPGVKVFSKTKIPCENFTKTSEIIYDTPKPVVKAKPVVSQSSDYMVMNRKS